MRYQISILVLTALLLSGVRAANAPAAGPTTGQAAVPDLGEYRNADIGVSFNYPKTWKVTQNTADGAAALFESPGSHDEPAGDQAIDFRLVKVDAQVPFETYVTATRKAMAAQHPDLVSHADEATKPGKYPAWTLDFEAKIGGTAMRVDLLIAVIGDHEYIFTFGSTPARFDAVFPIFEAMRKSFVFSK